MEVSPGSHRDRNTSDSISFGLTSTLTRMSHKMELMSVSLPSVPPTPLSMSFYLKLPVMRSTSLSHKSRLGFVFVFVFNNLYILSLICPLSSSDSLRNLY